MKPIMLNMNNILIKDKLLNAAFLKIFGTSFTYFLGVLSELEEVESRNEEYPLTRAVLCLLNELTNTPVPFTLGSGSRAPGLDPYIQYILNSILLTFANRAYKSASEKASHYVDLWFIFTVIHLTKVHVYRSFNFSLLRN